VIVEDLGLATDASTWALFAVVAGAWMLSLRCIGQRGDGWLAVPTSLLGLAWLGYGVAVVLRFLLLSYDSITFGDYSERLFSQPASVVNETLVVALLYWVCLVVGHQIARRAFTRGGVGPGPFRFLNRIPARTMDRYVYATTAVATACVLVSASERLDRRFVTPLSLLGLMWVVPAALVWWASFKHPGTGTTLGARWVVLVPGVARAVLSPYREHVVLLLFVVFIAGVFAGRRHPLAKVAVVVVGCVLVITPLVSVYRSVAWRHMDLDAAVEDLGVQAWTEKGADAVHAPWYEASRRFHALDSLLLTVDLVPGTLPYSNRAVFSNAAFRSIVPSVVWATKDIADRGMVFSRTIWSFGDPDAVEAAIAPSMAGDLFEVGGVWYVVAGALVWGLMLGLCDRWISVLTAPAAAAALALLALHAFGSVERDFEHCVVSLIQALTVLVVTSYLLLLAFFTAHLLAGRKASEPKPEPA
jgi:hypothetical protein